MWAKNGAKTLPFVLKRIDEVIPEDSVQKRVLVDDNSADDTREIANSFGWEVFYNEGKVKGVFVKRELMKGAEYTGKLEKAEEWSEVIAVIQEFAKKREYKVAEVEVKPGYER